jgi:predicted kinase
MSELLRHMGTHVPLPRLVVVTGPPGAGKTTIAAALRERLGLPLIAKDTLKEALGEALEVAGDRHASQRLGVATFQVQFGIVRELLASGVSLIAEGNFRAHWFEDLPAAEVVQVHVSAGPETLRRRLLERDTHRHPVHYDREAAHEIAERAAAGEWAALPLGGRLLEIDTTVWPDLDEVLATI